MAKSNWENCTLFHGDNMIKYLLTVFMVSLTLLLAGSIQADEFPISAREKLDMYKEVFGFPEEFWTDWKYQNDAMKLRSDNSAVAAWSSARGINKNTEVMARLIPDSSGVFCTLTYLVPNDDGFSYFVPDSFSIVITYKGLPQAMENCREAIETELSLQPAPTLSEVMESNKYFLKPSTPKQSNE
ncbi:MAG: hypothetical protein OXC42_00705 [Gammaproteobacteria bacterium]|nr:hypothetical protein [Gammaproteobacteria bacterium]